MQTLVKSAIDKMNKLGSAREPFVFLIDYKAQNFIIEPIREAAACGLFWQTGKSQNFNAQGLNSSACGWEAKPVSYGQYEKAFNYVLAQINAGNSYLLNLTQPTPINTQLSLHQLAHSCKAPYLVYLENEFVCFSPEIFVQIEGNIIKSFPMKGTIDASLPNAESLLRNNPKEMAEHYTIVDLIRNDLSRLANEVAVARFAYMDEVETKAGNLLQMSSEIRGVLNSNWHNCLGDIFAHLLPAGSITGAPKPKTMQVIENAECYDRKWYTGVFGVYDGNTVDSCVLIRYIEQQKDGLCFKSGGGITYQSNCEEEYNELVKKVYVPLV